jgi:hypothetical protein
LVTRAGHGRPAAWERRGQQLVVERSEARGDLGPVVSAAVCLRVSATCPAFLVAGGAGEERVEERVLVAGGDISQPVVPSATIAAGP